jgi:glycosyltransferase involved in cell wall biosynthesis
MTSPPHPPTMAFPEHATPARAEGGHRVSQTASTRAMPAITVVTVVFNGRALLAKSIASVLALKREDVAYIVVDGASMDGTVDDLRASGDQLDYWMSERDQGIYSAMNKAVQLVAPDSFVLFLGAGDTLLQLPDEATLAAAKADGTQILYGNVLIGDALFRSTFSAKLQYRNTLHHQGLFVRRGTTPEPWFDESLKVFSDWDLNLALYRCGVSARRLDFTVAYAEPDGISAKLHLFEIARIIARRCGPVRALAAVVYHGGLHFLRRHASPPARSRG